METLAEPLTYADRCDRCGRQAVARVLTSKEHAELLFCQGHALAYRHTFIKQGHRVYNASGGRVV